MNTEDLKRLAQTMDEKSWPATRDAYLAEQSRKTADQRLRELEEAQLLMSIGFLRIEKTLASLAMVVERHNSRLGVCK